mmetsp:Transcript_14153/g.25791  ORF Transcript_14153/g.25791 Transcript_14153/m.25791 type:complete len:120 (-) Transcript_14153:1078-1437(-)|eukprot:CAMPEP_0201881246 /NCGR_PEP_ID=MMETSP0902-20130614/11607_1 /ASSEMBLY_ACC=CAM_ASM_000551 /TAXON_ID=420261 /ORGANISM="Thalassiosira antarctica, Strain CCMP982" /LENGTH=119 /DNA_ID=CAMNT_0048409403 /DNA_START=81 /DNA_END=440 /DNA_ORIENTATION=-
MARRTRIGPDGSVIKDGDESGGGDGSGSGGGRRRWCRLPQQVDTFGFHLELKHFALVLLFISMTMGTLGFGLFVFFLSIYNYYQRQSSSSGGGSRWKDGKVAGTNIKGLGDLPKPPKGG